MKPIEVPYNFDKDLIAFLYKLDPSGNAYDCIYCCPYKDDYWAAKRNFSHSTGLDMQNANDMTREEYIGHIQNINKHFPGKIMLLLQQNNMVIEENLLRFYLGLGFKRFCVGSLEQAKAIKKISSSYRVIGSITMKATPVDFEKEEYKKYFDGFVLFFPYNRNIDSIKILPKCYDYILLVNCDCNISCQGTHHWFASKEVELSNDRCPNSFYNCSGHPDWSQIIRISPLDLPLFDPYIFSYKLQGREYSTRSLMIDICLYLSDYSYLPDTKMIEENYQTIKIKEGKNVI